MEAAAYPSFPEYAGYSAGGDVGAGSAPSDVRVTDAVAAADESSREDGKRRRHRPRNAMLSRFQAVFEPSTNRLSMKIYGSKKAVLKERLRQRSMGVWVVHPCSKFRYIARAFPR